MNKPSFADKLNVAAIWVAHGLFAAFIAAILIVGISRVIISCAPHQQAKFYEAANIVCDGLEEFRHLTDAATSIHLLIENKQFEEAHRVAVAVFEQYGQHQHAEGLKELRALILLLESLKGKPNDLPH